MSVVAQQETSAVVPASARRSNLRVLLLLLTLGSMQLVFGAVLVGLRRSMPGRTNGYDGSTASDRQRSPPSSADARCHGPRHLRVARQRDRLPAPRHTSLSCLVIALTAVGAVTGGLIPGTSGLLSAVAVMDRVVTYREPYDAVMMAGFGEHGRALRLGAGRLGSPGDLMALPIGTVVQ